MTQPYEFTPVVEQQYQKRDPSEFLPWRRCAEGNNRPGKLLIVRPLQMIDDYRPLKEGDDPNKWRGKLIVADIALLNEIPFIPDDGTGNSLRGFAAGTIFRNNTILLGFLNKAFREYIGKTCLGTVYTEAARQQGFQPSIHWRDLSGDAAAVDLARRFMSRFPDFLIPVAAQITPMNQPQPDPWSQPLAPAPQWSAHSGDQQPQQWTQPAGQPVQYQQQPPQGYAQPVSPAPQGNPYSQPDPWAQQAAQPVSPAPVPAPGHPHQGMSTLEQLKSLGPQGAQGVSAQGHPQNAEPPF